MTELRVDPDSQGNGSRVGEPADWEIYRGDGVPHDDIDQLPAPPSWRAFDGSVVEPPSGAAAPTAVGLRPGLIERASNYRPPDAVREMVNVALHLRRPLLITGAPGTGKSTLAYAVAFELNLGSVLYWPVSSRSVLSEALYRYDAIGRLQDINVVRSSGQTVQPPAIGEYVQLGPLGTALVATQRPRVLLIDEFDKCDPDLPNDLLNVLEEGQFEAADPETRVWIEHGVVRCRAFPFIVVTSNGEQEFPAAFHRRCVRVEIPDPGPEQIELIVRSQLGAAAAERCRPLIDRYLERRGRNDVVTPDQLLNAIFLVSSREAEPDFDRVDKTVLRSLSGEL